MCVTGTGGWNSPICVLPLTDLSGNANILAARADADTLIWFEGLRAFLRKPVRGAHAVGEISTDMQGDLHGYA